MLDIHFRHEIELSEDEHKEIMMLFDGCYDIYPSSVSFYHQPPHFRYLGYLNGRIVGHLSVAYRYVNWGGKFVPVYGISEFCVDTNFRKKGYATSLLNELITRAYMMKIFALISLTDSIGFYIKNGFKLVHEPIKWMMMKNAQTMGVMNRVIYESLVVYPLERGEWSAKSLDLLGPMF